MSFVWLIVFEMKRVSEIVCLTDAYSSSPRCGELKSKENVKTVQIATISTYAI